MFLLNSQYNIDLPPKKSSTPFENFELNPKKAISSRRYNACLRMDRWPRIDSVRVRSRDRDVVDL